MKRRVVVTGYGAISPIGIGAKESFAALIDGEHGFKQISSFNPKEKGCKTMFCAAVSDEFDPRCYSPFKEMKDNEYRKFIKRLDRHQFFAMISAAEAINMANLNDIEDLDALDYIGVNFATGTGGLSSMEDCTLNVDKGNKQLPYGNLRFLPNIAAGYIAKHWNFRGPNNTHCTACAASAHSISDAYNTIITGEANIIIAGGTESSITPVGISTFNAQTALSTRNDEIESASRPFTNSSDGFVMGEGSGSIVLEELEHAKNRGATIYAELTGIGRTCDGQTGGSITSPHPTGDGAKRAMLGAIRMSKRKVENVDYINAHGTSTGADKIEINAIRNALGEHALKTSVSSTKSSTGHLLGAAGALEAIFTIQTIINNKMPFTRTLTADNLDGSCKGVDHVIGSTRTQTVDFALSNSFGFGGTNACLAFSSYKNIDTLINRT